MNDNLHKINTYPYISFMGTIGSRLYEAMTEAGFKTQQALSDISNVPQPTISRTLKDTSVPENATISALAQACNVSTEWLITGRGDKYIIKKPFNKAISDNKKPSSYVDIKKIKKTDEKWRFKAMSYKQFLALPKEDIRDIEKYLEFILQRMNQKKAS